MMQAVHSWLQDLTHWASQWIIYCPFLTLATARNGQERESAEGRFVTKFLFALLIQVATGVSSVAIGSYLTLRIVEYRLELAERAIVTQSDRQRGVEEKVNGNSSELAVIRERHRLEELLKRERKQ